MKDGRWKKVGNPTEAMYGIGFLGAAFYYLQHAHTFSDGIIGILKALIWPGMLVYKVFGLLKM